MGPASSRDVATDSFTGAPRLAFGEFAVQCILHHLRAEKDSREPQGFTQILEINDLYINEISEPAQFAKPLAKQPEVIATLASASDPRQVIIKQHKFLADHTSFVSKEFLSSRRSLVILYNSGTNLFLVRLKMWKCPSIT